jgi:hypothetical protein
MKLSRILIALFGSVLLLASAGYARAANKGILHLRDTLSVDGHTLTPADYKVEWNDNGPNVQVKLLHNNETVVTFPAHETQQPQRSSEDAYATGPGPGGSLTLTQIYIAKHNVLLDVDENASNQHSSSPSPSPQSGSHGAK